MSKQTNGFWKSLLEHMTHAEPRDCKFQPV
jgi:hypothetical protein